MSYPKRGLSIDIGNDKIKIIEYARAKDKVKIIKSVLVDTPMNCINDGQILDVELMAETIKNVVKEHKIREKRVIYTVSSSKIITREVDLPDLPKKKLDMMIHSNAEEYFPVNLLEYTIDYAIIGRIADAEEKTVKVNIIAALTVVLESYVELTNLLNFKLSGIDYAGNSVVSFAKKLNIEQTYMLLDLGSDSTMVTIMNESQVKFNRNLVYGTKLVNNTIQNHFGVDHKEASRISIEQPLLSSTPEGNDMLGSDVASALNQVLNGVSRLVDYYISRNKDGIDRIFLIGGGTNIKNVEDYIENYFNIKTIVLDDEDFVKSKDDQYNKNKIFYANCIGAIFSEIDLLPKSLLNKSAERASMRLRLELTLLILAVGAAMVYYPYSQIGGLEKQKASLEANIAEKQVVLPIKAKHTEIIAVLNFHEGVYMSTTSTTETMLKLLEAMEQEIPEDVDYLNITNSEEGLSINCISSKKVTVVNLMTVLEKLTIDEKNIFSNVFVPGFTEIDASEGENGFYSFTIACEYNKGGQ